MRPATKMATALALLLGCGGAQDVPDMNLTANGHEAAAENEEREARTEMARYDPEAREVVGTRGPNANYGIPVEVVNPTDSHRASAEDHEERANEHRVRASEMREYEAVSCRWIPTETRHSCPLLLGVQNIDDVDGGVRITFNDEVAVTPVYEHLRCHLAYAAAEQGNEAQSCALWVHGARVTNEGRSLILTTSDGTRVDELRRRARGQLP